jgi:hypothetical protein
MRDYLYLEHMGMDIPFKIIQGMRAHNGTEPGLIAEDERFIFGCWPSCALNAVTKRRATRGEAPHKLVMPIRGAKTLTCLLLVTD